MDWDVITLTLALNASQVRLAMAVSFRELVLEFGLTLVRLTQRLSHTVVGGISIGKVPSL